MPFGEDEVTPALWLQLLGLKESASDGIETAVRYQRVLGEIHHVAGAL